MADRFFFFKKKESAEHDDRVPGGLTTALTGSESTEAIRVGTEGRSQHPDGAELSEAVSELATTNLSHFRRS